MKMWVKKMNKHGMHLLHAGENVETAIPSQASGSLNGNVARQVGGLVGAAVHAAMSKKQDAEATAVGGLADTMPNGDAVYVVTDQRLAAITYTALGAKPNELVGSYGYDQIAGVAAVKGRLASTVTLNFTDGSVGEFEVPRMAKPEKFVEILQSKVA
jgi:hypothetical protein